MTILLAHKYIWKQSDILEINLSRTTVLNGVFIWGKNKNKISITCTVGEYRLLAG
jgi:hypothetical protein